MKIAICDDEKTEQQLLRKYVTEWAFGTGDAAEIHCFDSAENFLFSWEDEKDYQVLILDIEMGNMNGMELARKIRETDRRFPYCLSPATESICSPVMMWPPCTIC